MSPTQGREARRSLRGIPLYLAEGADTTVGTPNPLPNRPIPLHIDEQSHLVNLRKDDALPVARLFSQPSPACGTYRAAEYAQLFNDHSLRSPGSAALVPMRHKDLNATLAIGSADPHRFSRELGTIFLEFIGDVLSRSLLRLA